MSSASPDSRGRPCRRPRTSRTGCVRDSYVSPTSSPTVRLSRRTSIRRTSSRSPSRNRGSPSSRVSPIRSDRKSTRLNSSHRTTSCPAYPYTTLFRSVLRVTRFQGKAVPEAEDLSHWMRAGFLRFSDFLAHGPIVSQDFDPQDLVAFALTKQGVALESRFADPIAAAKALGGLRSDFAARLRVKEFRPLERLHRGGLLAKGLAIPEYWTYCTEEDLGLYKAAKASRLTKDMKATLRIIQEDAPISRQRLLILSDLRDRKSV